MSAKVAFGPCLMNVTWPGTVMCGKSKTREDIQQAIEKIRPRTDKEIFTISVEGGS